jgi:anaerobic C4-dicarboxylate transporter DcuA
MIYATLISDKVGIIEKQNIILTRDNAIIIFMLTAATAISLFCKVDTPMVLNAPTFKSGMSACICVLGVAWLGSTFVSAHEPQIKELAGGLLETYPWLLSVALFFASMLLYSQAATAKALMPIAIMLGASPVTLVASFAAVSALFILPTYPTLLAAVEMDETGSTRIGKYVLDHPFIIPGTLTIVLSVLFGFIFGELVL